MPTIDFDALMGRPTVADVRNLITTAAAVVGWDIDALPLLTRLRKFARDVAPVAIEAATRINAEAIRGGILDYATGQWLDLLAVNVYGLDGRIESTFATTAETFTNPGDDFYTFKAGDVRVSNGVTVYTNLVPFTLAPAGQPGATATVDIIAQTAGSEGDAEPGTITEMVTTYGDVQCTNPFAARGTDRETDEQLRYRCQVARPAKSAGGPEDKYISTVLNARREDGTLIGITRVRVLTHMPAMGDITVYVADADGPPADGDVDRIDFLLRSLVVPPGVNFIGTFAAVPLVINIAYTAHARRRAGFTAPQVEALIGPALTDLFEGWPIGGEVVPPAMLGTVFASEVEATISSVQATPDDPRPVVNVPTLTLSGAGVVLDADGNVILQPNQVPVRGTVTGSVTLI